MMSKRIKIQDIVHKKKNGEKITMLTAYDYAFALYIDMSDIDMILVGDSLANVVLGLDSTRDVSLEMMLHHTKAVNRAVHHSLLIGDMPYQAYQVQKQNALKNAQRFISEGGCDAVKLEWFDDCIAIVSDIIQSGIPVMGHIGLTPQTADKLGGFKVQGRESDPAIKLIEQARLLEQVGCFSIVLECVPIRIAQLITQDLHIPTIGIGAGPQCDGQVLVTYDLLGIFQKAQPKFVKRFTNVGAVIKQGVEQFRDEVKKGIYPNEKYSYHLKDEEFEKVKKWLKPKG